MLLSMSNDKVMILMMAYDTGTIHSLVRAV